MSDSTSDEKKLLNHKVLGLCELKWFNNKELSNLNKFDALKDDRLVYIYKHACLLLGDNAFPLW